MMNFNVEIWTIIYVTDVRERWSHVNSQPQDVILEAPAKAWPSIKLNADSRKKVGKSNFFFVKLFNFEVNLRNFFIDMLERIFKKGTL